MTVAIYDTYVTRKNGTIMHFDIIVPADITDEQLIFRYGMEYLQSKNEHQQLITAKQCWFCHFEPLHPAYAQAILQKGYYIRELENCQ
jgi:hypothetical protein